MGFADVPRRMLPLSVSALKPVCTAIYVVGKRVEQSAAGITGPNVLKDLFIDWHPQVVIARRLVLLHRALRYFAIHSAAGLVLGSPCPPTARSFPLRPGCCNAALTMRKKRTRLKIAVVFGILALYVALLVRGSTESTRRSLQLRDETSAQDRVAVSVVVTNVNPATQELTAQLGFRLAGNIARDEVTPAKDMRLLINNVRGQQEFDFSQGKRMNRIEAVFPLTILSTVTKPLPVPSQWSD
jgi:hypothetical protein